MEKREISIICFCLSVESTDLVLFTYALAFVKTMFYFNILIIEIIVVYNIFSRILN